MRQLRELQLAALRETLAASLDPETCAIDAPGNVDEWREVEDELLQEDEIVRVENECSDEICANDQVAPLKSGLLGRILSLISGER